MLRAGLEPSRLDLQHQPVDRLVYRRRDADLPALRDHVSAERVDLRLASPAHVQRHRAVEIAQQRARGLDLPVELLVALALRGLDEPLDFDVAQRDRRDVIPQGESYPRGLGRRLKTHAPRTRFDLDVFRLAVQHAVDGVGHGVEDELAPELPPDVGGHWGLDGVLEQVRERFQARGDPAVELADDEASLRRAELDVPRLERLAGQRDHGADDAAVAHKLREPLFLDAVLRRDHDRVGLQIWLEQRHGPIVVVGLDAQYQDVDLADRPGLAHVERPRVDDVGAAGVADLEARRLDGLDVGRPVVDDRDVLAAQGQMAGEVAADPTGPHDADLLAHGVALRTRSRGPRATPSRPLLPSSTRRRRQRQRQRSCTRRRDE